eukprot:5264252-Pleurochrysis_carterae.AAC.3
MQSSKGERRRAGSRRVAVRLAGQAAHVRLRGAAFASPLRRPLAPAQRQRAEPVLTLGAACARTMRTQLYACVGASFRSEMPWRVNEPYARAREDGSTAHWHARASACMSRMRG